MLYDSLFSKCKAYLSSQAFATKLPRAEDKFLRPAITISRESGVGIVDFSDTLTRFLNDHTKDTTCPWTLFDKNLVQRVLEDQHLPATIEHYFPEATVSKIQDTIEELLDLHPDRWTLQQHIAETIYKLALQGHVILVGRGANFITASLPHVLHVRLIGSFQKRVQRVQQRQNLDHRAAEAFVKKTDHDRAGYFKSIFDADINDPLLYDLVINTDALALEDVAFIIGQAVLHRVPIKAA